MTTPATAAAAVPLTAVPTVPTAPGVPADLFAALLTAAGPVAGAATPPELPAEPAKPAKPAEALGPEVGPVAAVIATALATATVAPAPLPVAAAPVVHAPGQVTAAGTPARSPAPGQVKAPGTSAKQAAPGRLEKVADVPVPVPAAPTAVAAAPPPVDPVAQTASTRTVPPAVAAAAKRLVHDGDRTSLVVRLDPPELGAVLVRMTVREGQVEMTLRAPDLAAQGGLLAQAPEIQQVLREAGLDLASFSVSYGELAQQQSQGRRETPERGTPRQHAGADGTVPVTDDVPDPQPAGTWL